MHILMNEEKLKKELRKYRLKSFYKRFLGYSVFPAKELDASKIDISRSKYQFYSKEGNNSPKISNLYEFVGREHIFNYKEFFLSNNMQHSSLISQYAKDHSMRVNVFIESEKFLTLDELDIMLQEYADEEHHIDYLQGDDRKKLIALESEWLNVQRERRLDLEKFYSIHFTVIKNINDNDGRYGVLYLNNDGSIGIDYVFKDEILQYKKYIFDKYNANYIANKCHKKGTNADIVCLEDLNEDKNLDLQHASSYYSNDYKSVKRYHRNEKYKIDNFSTDYLRAYLKDI